MKKKKTYYEASFFDAEGKSTSFALRWIASVANFRVNVRINESLSLHTLPFHLQTKESKNLINIAATSESMIG